MTIPSEKLISRITTVIINSPCAMKQYEFKKITYIDGCDVRVTMYLELENNLKCCYFVINSSITHYAIIDGNFTGDMYSSQRFYFNKEKGAVDLCMIELYRILPDLKIDKLIGRLSNYIDEEVGNTYVDAENCSVCLEATFTKLHCKHLLCIPCQYTMHKTDKHFLCPLCRVTSVKYDTEDEDSVGDSDYDDNSQ